MGRTIAVLSTCLIDRPLPCIYKVYKTPFAQVFWNQFIRTVFIVYHITNYFLPTMASSDSLLIWPVVVVALSCFVPFESLLLLISSLRLSKKDLIILSRFGLQLLLHLSTIYLSFALLLNRKLFF